MNPITKPIFKEHDIIKAVNIIKSATQQVSKDTEGTIVHVYDTAIGIYEVEFPNNIIITVKWYDIRSTHGN